MISTQSLDFSIRRTARQLQCFLSNIQFDICSKHSSICIWVMDFSFIDGIQSMAKGFRKYGNIYILPPLLISAYSGHSTNIYIFLLQMQVTSFEHTISTSITISGGTSAVKFDYMNQFNVIRSYSSQFYIFKLLLFKSSPLLCNFFYFILFSLWESISLYDENSQIIFFLFPLQTDFFSFSLYLLCESRCYALFCCEDREQESFRTTFCIGR